MTISDKLIERVKKHEGYETKPYKDTVGKVTIGYGRNLEDNSLSIDELIVLFNRTEWINASAAENWAEMLLRHDLEKTQDALEEWLAIWPMCNKEEQTVLLDMAYNMGVAGLLTFEGMLHAIDNDDSAQAAAELLDSQYAQQVKTRAVDNAILLAGDKYEDTLGILIAQNPSRYNALKDYL
ncbi:glycoside hydrolase family protein [Spiribacter sp. 390]|uniref:Lysozyme n=1 Tax=Spiribacter pallidus TaxID=1987936 RepID=A0ABV3TGB6_9GAMM